MRTYCVAYKANGIMAFLDLTKCHDNNAVRFFIFLHE